MRFHYLGLAHLPITRYYNSCAFTQKVEKLARMLLSLGHEVILYGARSMEGAQPQCTEFVETHTLADIRADYGSGDNRFEIGYDWTLEQFRHDLDAKTRKPSTQKFYANAIAEINARKRDDDFLLLSMGRYHQPIAEQVNLFLTCEPGVGYTGSYARFRAFESAYIQNFTYGSEHPFQSWNGHNYDRIIPNYFDSADIEFALDKHDYYLYIGRIIQRKGIVEAAEACKAIGAKLIIVGQGGRVLPDGRLQMIDPGCFVPPGTWEYQGFASIEQRKKLMAHARAVFVPTQYLEPFAGTHIEAMLSGTPVITSDYGAFGSTVIDGVNGYRCSTLDDYVWAARNVGQLDPATIRQHAERYLMDRVKWQYQKWFDDMHEVYLSVTQAGRGWGYVRPVEPEWRKELYEHPSR